LLPAIRSTTPIGTITMDMRDEWIAALRGWAVQNDCIRELWLFGVSLRREPSGAERDGLG